MVAHSSCNRNKVSVSSTLINISTVEGVAAGKEIKCCQVVSVRNVGRIVMPFIVYSKKKIQLHTLAVVMLMTACLIRSLQI